jgi:hypothetical protein
MDWPLKFLGMPSKRGLLARHVQLSKSLKLKRRNMTVNIGDNLNTNGAPAAQGQQAFPVHPDQPLLYRRDDGQIWVNPGGALTPEAVRLLFQTLNTPAAQDGE